MFRGHGKRVRNGGTRGAQHHARKPNAIAYEEPNVKCTMGVDLEKVEEMDGIR